MARYVELRRHTDNDGDSLTEEGVAAAVELGKSLIGGYQVIVSSGAQRATQTAACVIAGLGEAVPAGVVVEPALRSSVEERWRAAYRAAGAGDIESLRAADPDLVRMDSELLAGGLRRTFDRLEEGQRALALGHSPTNEAAVFGLTGVIIAPMSKGEGVVVVDTGDGYEVLAAE
ncbi:MAG: histidine phosphatase family protein [Acidimicrobiia bacterium]|nr:histidine phosphatase family protein [Acidimicrobiia bacterium]